MAYSSPADLYAFGVPRGALPNPGRLAGVVSAADNTIELDVHGFALDDLVSFRAEAGGSLPLPLVAGADYYAIPVRESYFSVASVAGGPARSQRGGPGGAAEPRALVRKGLAGGETIAAAAEGVRERDALTAALGRAQALGKSVVFMKEAVSKV